MAPSSTAVGQVVLEISLRDDLDAEFKLEGRISHVVVISFHARPVCLYGVSLHGMYRDAQNEFIAHG